MTNKRIAVIGAGCAGLSAAATLAARGEHVAVFETSATLGGRARAISYQGQTLDNGQHILLGAYRETLRLLQMAGVDESQAFKRLPLSLTMLSADASQALKLKACPALPAPLHLLAGLLSAQGLSLAQRFAAIQLMVWMKIKRFKLAQDMPLGVFLQHHQQPQKLIHCLWEPLCLAALNTPLPLASSQVFLNVLRDSFHQQKHDSDILLPLTDLTQLISQPLAHYITQHGGHINTGTAIQAITQTDTGFAIASNKQIERFSHIIIACAPHQLTQINLRDMHGQPVHLVEHQPFNYQPITTVYLQYAAAARLPQAMTGLVGSLAQWVFDKGQLTQQQGLMAVVISAHAPFTQPQSTIAAQVAQELQCIFPHLGSPIWHKVITEKRATFSCEAGLNRPHAQTKLKNLYLAGDYVAGDYPATIEGALRSGIDAAYSI